MIDINELRRLAQAVSGWSNCNQAWLDQWEDPPAVVVGHIDEDGETYPVATIDCDQYYAAHASLQLAKFYAASNPATVIELLDRLEAAEKSDAESIAMYRKARDERDALRAKIEQMEKQEPVAWLHETRRDSDVVTTAVKHVWGKVAVGSLAAYSIPLYLAPGAQPAPSLPEGWKPVPIEPTETMIGEGSCASSLPGPHYISEGCAQQCWKYMIAAAPEAKP